jgi:isopentenyl-diphosphate delta-isomerase
VELLILVDSNDQTIGTAEKMAVHRQGLLHRAFSIFVTNSQGQLLLQQRAFHKYHSGGLWTNTCCSHPRPHETVLSAAHRRLQEEMGFTCPLQELFAFTYRAELEDGLIEFEYDHVIVGQSDTEPAPNPDEVANWQWIDPAHLAIQMEQHPELFTFWLRSCFSEYCQKVSLSFVANVPLKP